MLLNAKRLIREKSIKYKELSDFIYENGGLLIIVGGLVRNAVIGEETTDCDAEIYFLTKDELANVLKKKYKFILVGVSFGVFKIVYKNIDLSLPRKDECKGVKHTDFDVSIDPYANYRQSALRRDFTVNSIGYCMKYDKLLDPHNGLADIKKKILTPVDSETFLEDPLRLLRAVYFQAKLNFKLSDSMNKLFKENWNKIEFISKERISNEIKKIFTCYDPSIAFYNLSLIKLPIFDFFRKIEKNIFKVFIYEYMRKINSFNSKIIFIHMLNKEDAFFDLVKSSPNIKNKDIESYKLSAIIVRKCIEIHDGDIMKRELMMLLFEDKLGIKDISIMHSIELISQLKLNSNNKIFQILQVSKLIDTYNRQSRVAYINSIIKRKMENEEIVPIKKKIFNLLVSKLKELNSREILSVFKEK